MILLWENVCCICIYKFETTKSIIWPVSYLWRKHTTRTVTQIITIPAPVAGTAKIPDKYIPKIAYTFKEIQSIYGQLLK